MAVTRLSNSGIKTGILKYDSALAGYPPVMPAPTATATGATTASVSFSTISGATSYGVISSPGNITATGATSPISVTGLTTDTTYTFRVRATNSVGTGGYSAASNSVTPTDPDSYELISAGSPANGDVYFGFSGIPNTYKNLQIRYVARSFGSGTGNEYVQLRVRGNTGSNLYTVHYTRANGSTVSSNGYATGTFNNGFFLGGLPQNGAPGGMVGSTIVDINNYATENTNKVFRWYSTCDRYDLAAGSQVFDMGSGAYMGDQGYLSTLEFWASGGNGFSNISRFALYGIKG